MKHSQSIMIFGGADLQISLINKCKKLNLRTICVDPDSKAIAQDIVDEFYVVPGDNYEETLEIAKKENITGLCTAGTDKPLLVMAKIAKELSLPFPTIEAVKNSTNKFLMKEIFMRNRIPCAKHCFLDKNRPLPKLKEIPFDFPFIIKPIDNSGSRGVKYCESGSNLLESINNARQYSKSGRVLIEEYIEGEEISVEAVVFNNKVNIIQITDKITTSNPYRVETGHIQPSHISNKIKKEVVEIVKTSTIALELNNCGLHPELKITKNGPVIIETSPRLGGDYITSYLTVNSTGIDIEEVLINISLGLEPIIGSSTNEIAMIRYFEFPCGVVESIGSMEKFINNPDIIKFSLDLKEGQKINKITNSLERYGYIICKGLDRYHTINKINNYVDYIYSLVKII